MVVSKNLFTATLFSKTKNRMEKQPKDILKDLAADVLDNQVRPQDMGPETFKSVFSTPSMLTASLIVENLNRTEVDYFK